MTKFAPKTPGTSALNADQVTEFLLQHPDFFAGRDELLAKMAIPHQRGSAISLLERQLQLLREKDVDTQRCLTHVINNAKENERHFDSIRKFSLSLLESRDMEQAIEAVEDSLNHDFNVEFHQLILFSSQPSNLPVRFESKDITESLLGEALSNSTVFCGQLDEKRMAFIFGNKTQQIRSTAVAPLRFPDYIGLLALGSCELDRFKASLRTQFISYLGDILSRHLTHLMYIDQKIKRK
ncbi:DUF484 family protein [Candidatus Sororendozoicomonas aggregata]|uniref:DUF484 family protein n=1 Tax=Candidatus Sororendozoicomonas aggregata TaxID=3073239 RepID=UPI002ED5611F